MRSYPKLFMLLLVSLIMALTVGGCTRSVSNKTQESKLDSKSIAKDTEQRSSQPQYFFINGALLGSYEDNDWYSLCATDDAGNEDSRTFYAKDLLNQDSYYVYQNNKPAGVSKQIIWLTEEVCLGSFEAEDAPAKFAEYGQLYRFDGDSDTAYRIFDLPVKLGPELSSLKIPDYSFHTDFVFGANWDRRSSNDRFITNNAADLFPRELTYGVKPTAEGRKLLIDLFKQNNMENTSPNFTECVMGDLDNDGNDEYLMLAESPRSESGYPILCGKGKTDHLGVFNVIFYQNDGNIQTLYSDLRPYNGAFKADENNNMELISGPEYCIGINLFTAADLNSDGVYEIGTKMNEWECGFYLVYAMDNKGEYQVVMRSNFGM